MIYNIAPDEIYNLGAQSHVRVSFDIPEYTGDITGIGTTRILESIRRSGIKTKYYQASSSELFGSSPAPQNENTIFQPQSPYAAAKLYSYWMTKNYRDAFHMFASNGILFNHESPRRGETFVTRKITRAVAKILKGSQKIMYLGNLNAHRDWGFAPDYVEMMWLMLQQDKSDDFAIGTGISISIKDFVEKSFSYAGVELEWKNQGLNEIGIVKSIIKMNTPLKPGDVIIKIDPKYYRPTEVHNLKADITKAQTELNWQPRILVDELIKIMVDFDMLSQNLEFPGDGIKIMNDKGFSWASNEFKNIKQ
jgi:GDPmannose 4,6-dehydratase